MGSRGLVGSEAGGSALAGAVAPQRAATGATGGSGALPLFTLVAGGFLAAGITALPVELGVARAVETALGALAGDEVVGASAGIRRAGGGVGSTGGVPRVMRLLQFRGGTPTISYSLVSASLVEHTANRLLTPRLGVKKSLWHPSQRCVE